eukprot:GHVL01045042.1.p1 GENE.GHVL01045042.1~~GHVL01045042.1.p1  ORF type:complete len:129 (-),score=7.35 GHVL01045042.1:154-540(-)
MSIFKHSFVVNKMLSDKKNTLTCQCMIFVKDLYIPLIKSLIPFIPPFFLLVIMVVLFNLKEAGYTAKEQTTYSCIIYTVFDIYLQAWKKQLNGCSIGFWVDDILKTTCCPCITQLKNNRFPQCWIMVS